MHRAFYQWLSIYPVVGRDYLASWRNSVFVALFLTVWYGIMVVLGLYVGLGLYEVLEPIIDLMTRRLPILASILADFVALVLLVTFSISICLYLARKLIQGALVLFEGTDVDSVFYAVLAVAIALFIIAFVLSVPVVPATNKYIAAIGLTIIAVVLLLIIATWLHLRYRVSAMHRHWTGPARVFRHDLGAALAWLAR